MIPTEDVEGECLANWLRSHGYTFSHIGNESGQKGTINIIRMMAKKKRLGVSKGFPDYCIILKRGSLLFIELKRQRKRLKNGTLGASPSDDKDENQLAWLENLGSLDNVEAHMAYGSDHAIEIIQSLENK